MMKVVSERIGDLDCRIVSPQGLTGSIDRVAIFCHGFGAPGTDLVPIGQELVVAGGDALHRTKFVFPTAPIELEPGYDSRDELDD